MLNFLSGIKKSSWYYGHCYCHSMHLSSCIEVLKLEMCPAGLAFQLMWHSLSIQENPHTSGKLHSSVINMLLSCEVGEIILHEFFSSLQVVVWEFFLPIFFASTKYAHLFFYSKDNLYVCKWLKWIMRKSISYKHNLNHNLAVSVFCSAYISIFNHFNQCSMSYSEFFPSSYLITIHSVQSVLNNILHDFCCSSVVL